MIEVEISAYAGSFAENKDAARDLRVDTIEPALRKGDAVRIDFTGVDLATQSFVHALVSAIIRTLGAGVLDRMTFANCSPAVRRVVEIVVEYSQDDIGADAASSE